MTLFVVVAVSASWMFWAADLPRGARSSMPLAVGMTVCGLQNSIRGVKKVWVLKFSTLPHKIRAETPSHRNLAGGTAVVLMADSSERMYSALRGQLAD